MSRGDLAGYAIPVGVRTMDGTAKNFTLTDASPTAKGSPQAVTSATASPVSIICPKGTVKVNMYTTLPLYINTVSAITSANGFYIPGSASFSLDAEEGTTIWMLAVSTASSVSYLFCLNTSNFQHNTY